MPAISEKSSAGQPLRIELVRALDTEALEELAAAGREAMGESALDEWLLPAVAAWGLLLVARIGSTVTGSAQAIRCLEPEDFYCDILYVRRRWRRRGFGGMLLQELKRAAAAAGGRRLLVTLDPANRTAGALYRTAGFSAAAELRQFYGPGRDRVLMEAAL